MLVKTSTPHSIVSEISKPDLPLFANHFSTLIEQVITEISDLPQKDIYRQADERKVDEKPEKIFRLESEITINREVERNFEFTFPLGAEEQNGILKLEIKRSGSSIRATVRLQLLNIVRPLFEFSVPKE